MDHRFKKYVANRSIDIKVNNNKIQRGSGVFCIYFIIKCLMGDTPDQIFNDPYLCDKTVKYFVPLYTATILYFANKGIISSGRKDFWTRNPLHSTSKCSFSAWLLHL